MLAGIELVSDLALPLLQPTVLRFRAAVLSAPNGPIQHIHAQLLDAPMQVWRNSNDSCSELRFADGTRVRVAHDGSQIDVLDGGSALTAVLCGPALLLALAWQGIYCLHASALCTRADDPAVTVLLADSGIGKSTVAAVAATQGGLALVDDLCPMSIDAQGRLTIRPRFVQLKWSESQHWPANQPASLPIARLGLLQRGACTAARLATLHELLRMLLAHTVAARLFDAQLLQRHLYFCATLSSRLAQDQRGWYWTARDAAADSCGAMLELLHLIESSP